MSEPSTAAEWWSIVDENWDELRSIIGHHMDLLHAAYEKPGNAKSAPTGRRITEELEHLKTTRDGHKLARYFHAAWGMASDGYARERVDGWSALCELCSEEGVLDE